MSPRELITAIRTLTILPVPGPEGDFSRSFYYFPVVGAILAGLAWLGFSLGGLVFSEQPFLISLLVLALISLLTGFLHLDGLADTADAFGGGHLAQDVLRILKDSRIGSFGAVALCFDLGLKAILYAALFSESRIDIILCSLVLSRALQPLYFVFLPYARGPEGKSFGFSQGKGLRGSLAVEFGLIAIASILWLWPAVGAAGVLAGSLGALLAGWRFHARIGGITGDCVGAGSELFELLFLLAGLGALQF